MATQNLIPATIFCPKCGKPVILGEMKTPDDVLKLLEAGYSQGARGQCPCGVILFFLAKKMPEEPTFTIQFNVYKVEVTPGKGK